MFQMMYDYNTTNRKIMMITDLTLPDNAGGNSPTPANARRELPDPDSLAQAGIELDLAQARLVLTALSHVVARGQSKTRAKVYPLLRLTAFCCSLDFERDGRVYPAPFPNLRDHSWPSSATPMRRLGIDHTLLTDYWAGAWNRSDDACLPLDWVLAFAPAAAWPAIAAVIGWGPDATRARIEQAIVELGRTPLQRRARRRPDGATIARGTIKNWITCVWDLLQALVDLRVRVTASANPTLPGELLEAWTFKPQRPDPAESGAKEARLDTAGPPLEDCGRRLRELHRDWNQAPKDARYFRHRRLILWSILCLYGPRQDALRLIRIEDILPRYQFRDGYCGPALRLFPGKTRDSEEPHYLPLPELLFQWISDWIRENNHDIGDADASLFPSTKFRQKPLTQSGMYLAIAGRKNSLGGGSLALFPESDAYEGKNPHAFRHSAYIGAVGAGVAAKLKSPAEFGHVHPEDFARATVGHALGRTVSETYRDLNAHRLARAVVEEAWPLLWNDGAPIHGLDPEAISHWGAEIERIRLAITTTEYDLQALSTEREALLPEAVGLDQNQLLAALMKSLRLAAKSDRRSRELTASNQELQKAEATLERAKRELQPLHNFSTGMPPFSWTPERLVGVVRPGGKDVRPCQGDRTSRSRTRRSFGVRRSCCTGEAASR